MAGRRMLQGISPARFSVLVTIGLMVLVSAAAVTALVLWPAQDEFGFAGSWKTIGSGPSAGGVLLIELRNGDWRVTGIGLALLGDGRPKPAHLDGRTLVLDSGTEDIRYTVDESRDHLTMTWRSAAGRQSILLVRT